MPMKVSLTKPKTCTGIRMPVSVCSTQRSVRARHSSTVMKAQTAMISGVSLYAASKSVERGEWRAFADNLHLLERYPGISGIGALTLVARRDLPEFLKRTRDDECPEFTVQEVPTSFGEQAAPVLHATAVADA